MGRRAALLALAVLAVTLHAVSCRAARSIELLSSTEAAAVSAETQDAPRQDPRRLDVFACGQPVYGRRRTAPLKHCTRLNLLLPRDEQVRRVVPVSGTGDVASPTGELVLVLTRQGSAFLFRVWTRRSRGLQIVHAEVARELAIPALDTAVTAAGAGADTLVALATSDGVVHLYDVADALPALRSNATFDDEDDDAHSEGAADAETTGLRDHITAAVGDGDAARHIVVHANDRVTVLTDAGDVATFRWTASAGDWVRIAMPQGFGVVADVSGSASLLLLTSAGNSAVHAMAWDDEALAWTQPVPVVTAVSSAAPSAMSLAGRGAAVTCTDRFVAAVDGQGDVFIASHADVLAGRPALLVAELEGRVADVSGHGNRILLQLQRGGVVALTADDADSEDTRVVRAGHWDQDEVQRIWTTTVSAALSGRGRSGHAIRVREEIAPRWSQLFKRADRTTVGDGKDGREVSQVLEEDEEDDEYAVVAGRDLSIFLTATVNFTCVDNCTYPQGLCFYNKTRRISSCLCTDGFTGDDCASVTVIAIVHSSFVVVVLGLTVLLCATRCSAMIKIVIKNDNQFDTAPVNEDRPDLYDVNGFVDVDVTLSPDLGGYQSDEGYEDDDKADIGGYEDDSDYQ